MSKGNQTWAERLNIGTIYNAFLSLPPNQQTLALVATGVVIVIIILLPISLASSRIAKMNSSLKTNTEAMSGIVYEIESYDAAKNRLKGMEESLKSGYDTALSTTIESLAKTNQVQDKIESIKERPVVSTELFDESIVEVRITNVTLPQLIDFLYGIEYDKTKLLRIKDLRLKTRFDNSSMFDVSFQVSTYRLQQEG